VLPHSCLLRFNLVQVSQFEITWLALRLLLEVVEMRIEQAVATGGLLVEKDLLALNDLILLPEDPSRVQIREVERLGSSVVGCLGDARCFRQVLASQTP